MDIEKEVLQSNGFEAFNPMQKKALQTGIFENSLVVSAPTASGKTVIAELMSLHSIINEQNKVVYTCPLKALASEHYNDFKKKYSKNLKVKATLSTGDFDSSSSYLAKFDLIFTTYEKCLPFDEYLVCKTESGLRFVKIGDLFEELRDSSQALPGKGQIHLVPKKKYYAISFSEKLNKLVFSEIEAVSKTRNNKNLLDLKLDSGRTIRVTEDHKLFALGKGVLKTVEASQAKDKYLSALSESSELLAPSIGSLDMLKLFLEAGLEEHFSVKFSSVNFDELVHILTSNKREKKRAKELAKYYLKTSIMPLSMANKLKSIEVTHLRGQRLEAKHDLPIHQKLTESFGKILGYFVSEGSYSQITESHGYICLRLPTFNRYILCDLKAALEKEKIPFNYDENSSQISVKSKQLYYLFKRVWGIGKAEKKRLPDFVFFAPEEFIRGLLQGLFNGDGGPNPLSIDYATKNQELALQISLLLTRFNVQTYIYPQKIKGSSSTYTRLNIVGGQNLERFSRLVGELRPLLADKIKVLIGRNMRRDNLFNNHPLRSFLTKQDLKSKSRLDKAVYQAFARNGRCPKEKIIKFSRENQLPLPPLCSAPLGFLKVKKKTKLKKPSWVYNIKTKAGNYFTGHGVLVHNCDSLIRHKAHWLNTVGTIVVDEIHEIDSDRGPTLEMLITKMKALNPNIKVLGLSATIPNAKDLSQWLEAKLVESDYRPVPLKEGIYFNGEIAYGRKNEALERQKNELEEIASDTLKKGKQLLVFAQTRKSAEQIAVKLSSFVFNQLEEREKKYLKNHAEEVLSALESPTEQCKKLTTLVEKGVAFHHAGLIIKQRTLIEDFFREGKLKVIAATPTLAMGVNLPSHTVLIHSIYRYGRYGSEAIPVREYKQWVGRAGRPRFDSEGRSILIARNELEKDELRERYVEGEIEEISSKLSIEPILRMHLLSLIANRFVFDLNSLEQFFSKTFYALQYGDMQTLFAKLNELVEELRDMEFVRFTEKGFEATRLGQRVSELYLDPVSAFNIINSLKENERGQEEAYLMLLADCFELFPYPTVPAAKEAMLWGELMEEKRKFFFDVDRKMYEDDRLLNKFQLTKVFQSWINEVSEQELLDEFKLQPGILRSKRDVADWLIYASIELEKCLGLKKHFMPLTQLRNRMKYGIKEELLPLVQLRNIGRVRARLMFRKGVKSIGDLKKAELVDLSRILGPKIALSVKQQLGQVKDIDAVEKKQLEQAVAGQKKLENF